MMHVVAVAAGSALGGAARYAVGMALAGRSAAFPLGTLVVNVAGGFAVGLLARLLPGDATPARLFLMVGFCGGFTTFSTFSLETVRLMQADATGRAGLYAIASVAASVAAAWAGLLTGASLIRPTA